MLPLLNYSIVPVARGRACYMSREELNICFKSKEKNYREHYAPTKAVPNVSVLINVEVMIFNSECCAK